MLSRMSFRTGVYSKGVLVMDATAVARKYARTWLPVDIMLVSIDWVAACLQIRTTQPRPAACRTSLASDKLLLLRAPGWDSQRRSGLQVVGFGKIPCCFRF